ncbi:MAG: hypothetical protein Q7V20_14735 [Aquabacterium sp.]|uniref:hypothetical protein n=1 Tax=Aquabacterium sp. TaxID=1872578 RepID=UPI00272828FF|nr:hypothetical protein [Aquabacterium sp.]MDO9004701.1 hypothetical protein [Aquabacterium sp.]
MKLRSISFAAATLVLAASANALTIDWTKMQGTSTLAFSDNAISLFQANGGKLAALGNTTPVGTSGWSFALPITNIEINSALKIASGQASGSALDIIRRTLDEDTGEVIKANIVLANFKLDYINHKVLADTTANGAATLPMFAVYDFNTATPLALKYKFPFTINGNEVLDKLILTPAAVDLFASSLGLSGDAVLNLVRTTEFGTLTQTISTNARKPAVNKTPYVPAP